MGWTFHNDWTRDDLIADLTTTWTSSNGYLSNSTKTRHLKWVLNEESHGGNGVLWTVRERDWPDGADKETSADRWIGCDLLDCYEGSWGVKNMEEIVGPYYYDCPLEFLDMVPIETYGGNKEWREKVIHYHQHDISSRTKALIGPKLIDIAAENE